MTAFLTQTEKEFLSEQREFPKSQQYYLKSRILKKLRVFYGTELPLLENKGYLAAFSKKLAAGWKDDIKKADPKGFDPLTCGYLHHPHQSTSLLKDARRFRRPPRYPDYATGPNMLNKKSPYINEIVIIN